MQIGTAVAGNAAGNTYMAGYTDAAWFNVPDIPAPVMCARGTNTFLVKFAAGTSTPVGPPALGGVRTITQRFGARENLPTSAFQE